MASAACATMAEESCSLSCSRPVIVSRRWNDWRSEMPIAPGRSPTCSVEAPEARSAISWSIALSVAAIEFIVLVRVRTSLGPRTGSGSSSKEPSPIDRARLVSRRSGRSVVQLNRARTSRLTAAVTGTRSWVRSAASSAAIAEASRFVTTLEWKPLEYDPSAPRKASWARSAAADSWMYSVSNPAASRLVTGPAEQ